MIGTSDILPFAQSQLTMNIPMILSRLTAGFPSPADDFIDTGIDLNHELIQHPSATYFARVQGDSMTGAGIDDGDLIIIDRSLKPINGQIVVCSLDGEFTIKKLHRSTSVCELVPANSKYKKITIQDGQDFLVFGVVIHVIKSYVRPR